MKTNKLAIASFCLGIASYFFWELSIIPILAIILGVIAVVIILKNGDRGLYYGIIGIALGILGLLFRIYLGGVHAPLVSKPVPETQADILPKTETPTLSSVTTPEPKNSSLVLNFKCPEDYLSDKEKNDDLKRYLSDYIVNFPDATIGDVFNSRYSFLVDNNCFKTLEYIKNQANGEDPRTSYIRKNVEDLSKALNNN